jgi:hypothetical protein
MEERQHVSPEVTRMCRASYKHGMAMAYVARQRGFRTMADVPMVEQLRGALAGSFGHVPTDQQWLEAANAWMDGYLHGEPLEWEGMEYV